MHHGWPTHQVCISELDFNLGWSRYYEFHTNNDALYALFIQSQRDEMKAELSFLRDSFCNISELFVLHWWIVSKITPKLPAECVTWEERSLGYYSNRLSGLRVPIIGPQFVTRWTKGKYETPDVLCQSDMSTHEFIYVLLPVRGMQSCTSSATAEINIM